MLRCGTGGFLAPELSVDGPGQVELSREMRVATAWPTIYASIAAMGTVAVSI